MTDDLEMLTADLPILVFIYGPPAAGKLTVANALSKATGLRVFHNHASIDLAHLVLDPYTPESWKLVKRIRLEVIEAAILNGVSLIFTMFYAHPEDAQDVKDIEETVVRSGGRVCYVQLRPTREALHDRVVADSRRKLGKVNDVSLLSQILEGRDFQTRVHESDLSLDNTSVSAGEIALRIQTHFALGRSDVVL